MGLLSSIALVLLAGAAAHATPRSETPAAQPAWIAGDSAAALQAFSPSPRLREDAVNRAVVLLYRGEALEAEAELAALAARESRFVPALRWLGRAQADLARSEAERTAAALVRSPKADGLDALWAGQLCLQRGHALQARAYFLESLRRDPGLSLSQVGLRDAEAALGSGPALAAEGDPVTDLERVAASPPPLLIPGEVLRFKARYLFLRLGSLTLSTLASVDAAGRPVRHVLAEARSNPSLPFHVDSHFESEIGEDGGLLSHQQLGTDSDSGTRAVRYELCRGIGRCLVRWADDGVFGYSNLPLPAAPQDGISLLYLLRALARERGSAVVATAVDATWKATRLRTLGVERIAWAGRHVDAVHMQSQGSYRGPGGLSGVVDVWVSADDRALPLRAKMKVAIGSVKLELLPEESADPGD